MAKGKPPKRNPERHGKISAPAPARRFSWLVPGVALCLAAAIAVGWYAWPARNEPAKPVPGNMVAAAPARFVGAQACAGCHAREDAAWRKSQHAAAMQDATEATVLGDFERARFTYNGITSTFFRKDGKFYANTDGADGKLADFQISHTFGLYPLQQYLVSFPDGRKQALSIAWDARPKAQGGGRWFHLYPDEAVTAKDPLHWTGRYQNWNWMCADCHTTRLERNYDAASNSYDTRWSEMNVACEACHGPGSAHIAWAKHPDEASADHGLVVALDERRGVSWQPDRASGNAVRSVPMRSQRELVACAQCHSRRASFAPGMGHDGKFSDTHDIALLGAGLYEVDGQQHDEVYNLGSFLQSKMHARGVTCSDCHDPHSGKLRASGNAVCSQCHAPAKYDLPAHTLHAAGSPAAQCASCHLPTRTYMGIDPRHDHSFRIPRPDLSAALGTPNACTSCHQDKPASWAAAAIEQAYGPVRKGFQTFGPALQAARVGAPGAAAGLMQVAADAQVPAIARATAIAELANYLDPAALPTLAAALSDPEAMVRGAALEALLAAPPAERLRLAAPLAEDRSRIVRIKAARALAAAPAQLLTPAIERAFSEYVEAQHANADRPEALANLGVFYADRGDGAQAERDYLAAIALAPDFSSAYVNLADLYQRQGREAEAQSKLEAGLRAAPGSADLLHALGLSYARQGRIAQALPWLARAAGAAPGEVQYAYVYGVALHDQGRRAEALAVLERALQRFPRNAELLAALSAYAREAGDAARADAYASRLAELAPSPDAVRR